MSEIPPNDEVAPAAAPPAQRPQNQRRLPLPLLILAILLPTIITYIYFFLIRDYPQSVQKVGMAICKFVQFALPVFCVYFVLKRRPRFVGPNSDGFGWGTLFGAASLAAGLALYAGWLKHTDVFQVAKTEIIKKVGELGCDTTAAFLILGLFYVICHSLLEEYYWRWFVFGELQAWVSLGWAIVISSVGFMLHHVLVLANYFGWSHFATWFFSFCVAVGGAFWAWLYHRTGRLYAPWWSHAILDAVIFGIGYDLIFR